MKRKKIISLFTISVALIMCLSGCGNKTEQYDNESTARIAVTEENNSNMENKITEDNNTQINIDKESIQYTGWLKTVGAELQNEKGEPIQLRGISSHGIQWFPNIVTYDSLKQLKDTWKINIFRIAMYTDSNANGYIAHPDKSKEDVAKIVEYAKQLDMYVIIDWHILSDNNPQIYQSQAKEFFSEMAEKYSDTPNVIYEICNEPNGNNVKWNENVKPYAEEIVSTIKQKSPRSLVIVGTPDWCKDLKSVADNPLNYDNVVYSCHFYAGSHGDELKKQIIYCMEKNIPVFVSECGITDASGNGKIYPEEYKAWIEFLSKRNISWLYWSFCNKDESSSILATNYVPENTGLNINDYLTESGKIIKKIMLNEE